MHSNYNLNGEGDPDDDLSVWEIETIKSILHKHSWKPRGEFFHRGDGDEEIKSDGDRGKKCRLQLENDVAWYVVRTLGLGHA